MNEIIWNEMPDLRRPMMLCGFTGLFDVGEAATEALSHLRRVNECENVAEIDPDRFLDFSVKRPTIKFDTTGRRTIEWPTVRIFGCRTEAQRDLLVVSGPEPALRWSSFAALLVEVVRKSGTEMVVTVGAVPAVTAHSRDLKVTGSTADPALASHLGLNQPTYEGPTGVVGVVNTHLEAKGIPVVSLRVDVPHYVPGPPNPKATQALLKRLEGLTSVPTQWSELDREVVAWAERVEEVVKSDPESESYVRHLEEQADRNLALDEQAADIGDEVESYLRQLREDDD